MDSDERESYEVIRRFAQRFGESTERKYFGTKKVEKRGETREDEGRRGKTRGEE